MSTHMSRRSLRHAITFIAVLLVASLFSSTAPAQSLHTLIIEDGQVYINGRLVAESELPRSLDTSGVEARFSFSDAVESVVEINDRLFKVEDGRLVDVASTQERQSRVAVYFRQQESDQRDTPIQLQLGADQRSGSATSPAFAAMQHHTTAVQEQVRQLQQLIEGLDREEIATILEQLQVHATRASRFAGDVALLEMQSYLEAVQQSDEELHARLMRERELERESKMLAEQLQSGEASQEERAELRAKLSEIFELKQQNRRSEVEELERKLDRLQKRLEKRERFRDRIIERRLEHLLNAEKDR